MHKGESQYTLTTQSESYPEFPGKSRKLSRDQVEIFQEAEETTQNQVRRRARWKTSDLS